MIGEIRFHTGEATVPMDRGWACFPYSGPGTHWWVEDTSEDAKSFSAEEEALHPHLAPVRVFRSSCGLPGFTVKIPSWLGSLPLCKNCLRANRKKR